jgi:hypothetical protein
MTTTVQDLIDWCAEHGTSPEFTNVNMWADSSLGYMPAVIKDNGYCNIEIYLDYV